MALGSQFVTPGPEGGGGLRTADSRNSSAANNYSPEREGGGGSVAATRGGGVSRSLGGSHSRAALPDRILLFDAGARAGAQFTCFTGTKVQLLTLRARRSLFRGE